MAAAVAAVGFLVFLDRDDRLDPPLAQVGAVGGRGVRLIAIAAAGRVRGLPLPGREMRMASIRGMNFGQSPCWPGVSRRVRGRQRRSAVR